MRPGYSGYAAATPQQVLDAVEWAYASGIQIITHANGEAASDLLITAMEQAQKKHGRPDLRPVLIHGQFQREDQVDSYVRLGVFPSLFPMHTFYWGDWHRDHTVGPEAGENISPTGWYRTRGSMFSTHTDAPVAYPEFDARARCHRDPADAIRRHPWTQPAGGRDDRPQGHDDLAGLAAFRGQGQGSIKVGKLADFVVLTDDPTAVDPETIEQIKVAETIKEGVTVYSAPPEKLKKADAGRAVDHPFSTFLTALANERDFRNLPENRQTPLNRKIMASGPHNRACVSAVLADLTEAMLHGSRS